MRISALILCLTLLAPSLARAEGSWTWLFYMQAGEATSAEMEESCIRQIRAMMKVEDSPQVAVLVQTDRGKNSSEIIRGAYGKSTATGGVRYRIGKDAWKYSGDLLGDVNTGDPKALLDFIQWGMKEAPAEHYVLVIKGHGSGVISWRGVGAVGSALPGEVRLNNYIAADPDSNDILTLFELSQVLAQVKDARGKKLELMVADSCFAASVESLFQLRESVDVLVGSEATTYISAFDFAPSLAETVKNPAIATEALASNLTKSFADRNIGDEFVLGAFRTSEAENLAGALDGLTMELIRACRENSKSVASRAHSYQDGRYWDVVMLLEVWADPKNDMENVANSWDIKRAAMDVLQARRKCQISSWYKGKYWDAESKRPNVGGLSLYWPKKDDYKSERPFYRALALSKSTHWDEFLDAWHQFVETAAP